MESIDYEVFLCIGQSLVDEEQSCSFTNTNLKTKSFQEYKAQYLQTLNEQMEYLTKKKEKLLNEYKLGIEFNRESIEKITYLNNKLRNNNNTIFHHYNTTATFLSLRLKKYKIILNETIENNFKNNQNLHELEKEINFIEFCIFKTKGYIQLNS
jgi:hypothetical protein